MKRVWFAIILVLVVFSSNLSLIRVNHLNDTIEQDYSVKKESITNPKLSNILDIFESTEMSDSERLSMKYLYAYMQPSDMIDYSSDFYLSSVEITHIVRKQVGWAKSVPDDIFYNFVLPLRVSSENLDSIRYVAFAEVFPRIKSLSMYDAVIDVNRWCHERVEHKYTKGVVNSPLSIINAAYGRSEELSVLVVSVLRAVGIPARLVSSPRCSHIQENHTWVEVWVDGRWYFIDACMPDVELNRANLRADISKNVTIYSRVYGRYLGDEDVLTSNNYFTDINLSHFYSDVYKSKVVPVDNNYKDDKKADLVLYKLMFSNLYPVVYKAIANVQGFEMLKGDGGLVGYANKGNRFGFGVVGTDKDSVFGVVIDREVGEEFSMQLNLGNPNKQVGDFKISQSQIDSNNVLLVRGDKIRENYISTFMSRENASAMAWSLRFNSNDFYSIVSRSRGNSDVLCQFLSNVSELEQHSATQFLQLLSDNDIVNISLDELNENFYDSPVSIYRTLFKSYIQQPRIANEHPSLYKNELQRLFGEDFIANVKGNPKILVEWVDENIEVDSSVDGWGIPISPIGVYQSNFADSRSRDIFFVACCRAFGIPALIEQSTGRVQYFHRASWYGVSFKGENLSTLYSRGRVQFVNSSKSKNKNPHYDLDFSISKYENGRFERVVFGDREGSATLYSDFKDEIRLERGYYMLSTTNISDNGDIILTLHFFNINSRFLKSVDLGIE